MTLLHAALTIIAVLAVVVMICCGVEIFSSLKYVVGKKFFPGKYIIVGREIVKVMKPEVKEIYAYKIFSIRTTLTASTPWPSPAPHARMLRPADLQMTSEHDTSLYPHMMSDWGPYKLIDANWYLDKQLSSELSSFDKTAKLSSKGSFISKDAFRQFTGIKLKNCYPMLSKIGSDSGRGFWCFKTINGCMQYHGPSSNSENLICKIRIWGDVIECKRGYRAEYFEIMEIYTISNEDYINHSVSVASGNRLKDFIRINRVELAERLGWPFPIYKLEKKYGKYRKKEEDPARDQAVSSSIANTGPR